MSASLERTVSRRRVVSSIGLGILIVAGAAVLYPGNPVASPAEQWRDIVVPATDALTPVNPVASESRPYTGLRELYVVSTDRIPFVAVAGIFDSSVDRDGRRANRPGLLSFQTLTTPFNPENVPVRPLRVREHEAEQVLEFAGEAAVWVREETGGRFMQGATMFDIVRRPDSQGRFALVMGEGIVDRNRTPSPLSYVTVGFRFENFAPKPLNTGPLV
jgi:hypothetical protein